MGGGAGGAYGPDRSANAVAQNIQSLKREFKVSEGGYFGQRSEARGVRLIHSNNPLHSGENFFALASRNADRVWKESNGALRATFNDGTHIVWRPRSNSDGSPAIRLQFATSTYGVARIQRIHFVKEKL